MSLAEVITHIVSYFPTGVTGARLVRLLYLVDEMTGHGLVRDWVVQAYGPRSKRVVDTLDDLVNRGILISDPGPASRFKTFAPLPRVSRGLGTAVKRVVGEHGHRPFPELASHVAGGRPWSSLVNDMVLEASRGDAPALQELVDSLWDTYEQALRALPSDTLLLLAMTLSGPLPVEEKARVARGLLRVLASVQRHLSKHDPTKPLPRQLKARVLRARQELQAAVEATLG